MAAHHTPPGVDWPAVLDELASGPIERLGAADLTRLADAQFWCDRLDDSIATRRQAYARHVDEGDERTAALAAWRIFYEHFLVGEAAPAAGWLERCRSHAVAADEPVTLGWLRLADGDVASRSGRVDEAIADAAAVVDIGRRHRAADLTAMGLQLEGRSRIERGERLPGLALLDEAMVAVVNDELEPIFTGWVYCNVISTCYHVADLRRATEWSDAAERWCAALRDGRLYRGLCRVYAAELATLNGDWPRAETQVELACDELVAHDPRYAGSAFYLAGELRRRQGDRAGADAAFERARELGHPTQPGHALGLAEAGRVGDALRSLRSALRPPPGEPLPHAQLLGALVAVGTAGVDGLAVDEVDELAVDEVDVAVEALGAIAEEHDAPVLDAMAALARARRALVAADVETAITAARVAAGGFDELGCPYDAADARTVAADAAALDGDLETARHELAAARSAYVRLDASPRVEQVDRRVAELDGEGSVGGEHTAPLTGREIEVLGLVAIGRTNRQIADELHLSPHTVARHVSNLRIKLDAPSRTAAVARGVELGLIGEVAPGR